MDSKLETKIELQKKIRAKGYDPFWIMRRHKKSALADAFPVQLHTV